MCVHIYCVYNMCMYMYIYIYIMSIKKNMYIYIYIYKLFIYIYTNMNFIDYVNILCIHIHPMCISCIYGPVLRLSTPHNGLGPQVAPPSLLFASYWQHF